MNWIRLDKRDEANNIIAKIDWPHSFIREAYIVSPSYILPDSLATVAPDCLPSARVFVSSASRETPGLELLFVGVKEFSVWFQFDLEPEFSISKDEIMWDFHGCHTPIKSKCLYYKLLDRDSWGHNLRYTWDDIYDKGGEIV